MLSRQAVALTSVVQAPRNPVTFADIRHWERTFGSLIHRLSEAERETRATPYERGAKISWAASLDGSPLACFTSHTLAALLGAASVVGSKLSLTLNEPVVWEAQCTVIVYQPSSGGWALTVGMWTCPPATATQEQGGTLLQEDGVSTLDIRRSWNSTPYDRMRLAISCLANADGAASGHVLDVICGLPTARPPGRLRLPAGDDWAVPSLQVLNEAQVMAIRTALQQPVTLLQGPPGTGKTETVAAIIYHQVRQHKTSVLACAPANVTVDHIAAKLIGCGLIVLRFEAAYAPGFDREGLPFDGTLELRNEGLVAHSAKIPFLCGGHPRADDSSRVVASVCPSPADAAGEFSEGVKGGEGGVIRSAVPDSEDVGREPSLEDVIRNATPVAYSPFNRTLEAWSEGLIEVRLPAAALKGHSVAILPLDDHRVKELGVLISPGIYQVSDEGTIKIRVCNPSTRKVSVPALAPMARFVVDPRLHDTDLEYTTEEIFEKITVDRTRSQEELDYLREMLSKRRRLFASVLGWAHATKQNIATPTIDNLTHAPPCAPSRRRSAEEDATLLEYVTKLRNERLIEPTVSPYNAIPMLIKKPDGTFRVVLDYRALNLLTLKDNYPLPNIDKYLSALADACWFTVGDLLQGFHQVELDESSKPKTAFSTPWGQFAFTRMPMGLTSSPGAFMRLVDAMMRGLPPTWAYAFIDDIMIPSAGTFKEHIDQVGVVFDKLIDG